MKKPFIESKGEGKIGIPTKRDIIIQKIQMSGLWDGDRARTHSFILSPSIYNMSQVQKKILENFGESLQDVMSGLSRIATIAGSSELGSNKGWYTIRRILSVGVPAIYRDIQYLKPSRVPGICKVDFMLGQDGQFYVAEIDGHNKHGLGYTTLTADISRALKPKADRFPGVPCMLARYIAKRSPDSNQLILLYGDQERFYLPEFDILRDALKLEGVDLKVVSELDLDPRNVDLGIDGLNEGPMLFLDFPFLFRKPELNLIIANKYQNGEIDFIIPPKPYFSAKSVLALLRNDLDDPQLEAILASQINLGALKCIRQHIPPTFLVSKDKPLSFWNELIKHNRYVLKENISSGMKGTMFSDNASFQTMLKNATRSPHRFILQQEIQNAPQQFLYFDDQGNTLMDTWYMRVTVYFSMRQIVDIDVTARRNKKVHGAKDCIQIGTIITS